MRGNITKDEIVCEILKIKNSIYDRSFLTTATEAHREGAHAALNKLLEYLAQFRS